MGKMLLVPGDAFFFLCSGGLCAQRREDVCAVLEVALRALCCWLVLPWGDLSPENGCHKVCVSSCPSGCDAEVWDHVVGFLSS